jgi:hypothetical protein
MGSELQGAGGYWVGDADRNRTVDLLKEAHAAGYLTLEETDERLGFWFFPWPLLWIFFFAFGRRGRASWRPPRW